MANYIAKANQSAWCLWHQAFPINHAQSPSKEQELKVLQRHTLTFATGNYYLI